MFHYVEPFHCPACDELIGPWTRGITFHARTHGMTAQDMYDHVHGERPTCACKPVCTMPVRWYDWKQGYNRYAKGHSDVATKSAKLKERAKEYHWSRGKSAATDERIARSSKKKSETSRARHASGELVQWNKGKTKHDNETLATHSRRMRGRKHRFYNADHVMELLVQKLGDGFTMHVSLEDIAARSNNRTMVIELECVKCGVKSTTSAYNIIRKAKHRCRACDVPKKWTSVGETEMVNVLENSFGETQRFVRVNGWSIDAYVSKIDTFFQFDGVYWHGIDRSVKEIKDPKIARKRIRDLEQNAWFDVHDLNLVRITDVEWKDASDKRAFIERKLA